MIFMKKIKSFTNFVSVNEEFVPSKVTNESRNKALLELSKSLDSNKKDLLNLLLLSIAAYYSCADQLPTFKRYKDQTGASIFDVSMTATEVRGVYHKLCKGLSIDQFKLLTEVLAVFAVDLGIDSKTIGNNALVVKQAIEQGVENPFYRGAEAAKKIPGYEEPEAVATGGGAEIKKESLKAYKIFNRILESINN
jgi:hypothetical protein